MRWTVGAIVLAATAGPAQAGSSVRVTPIGGAPFGTSSGALMEGLSWGYDPFPPDPAGLAAPGSLYDNVPTFLGGSAEPGIFGPFGSPLVTATTRAASG